MGRLLTPWYSAKEELGEVLGGRENKNPIMMNLGVPAHQMPDIAVLTAPPVFKFIPCVWAGGLYFPCYKTKEVIRTIPF